MTHLKIYLEQELQKYPEIQSRFTNDFKNKFLLCISDSSVGEIIEGLQDIQKISMERFSTKRKDLIRIQQQKSRDLEERHSSVLRRRSVRNAGMVMVPDENMIREKEDLQRRHEEELIVFDRKIVLDLDQKLLDQQQTLETAGVPGFFTTSNPEEVDFQMKLIAIIFEMFTFTRRSFVD